MLELVLGIPVMSLRFGVVTKEFYCVLRAKWEFQHLAGSLKRKWVRLSEWETELKSIRPWPFRLSEIVFA